MARGLILYLHGFRSSPQSWKIQELHKAMQARGQDDQLLAPALPVAPAEAMALLESILQKASGPVALVGSSLGGFYATWLAEKYDLRAVLINPAVAAQGVLKHLLGVQTNLHTGESFEFTQVHVEQLAVLDVPSPSPARYLLLVEKGDEVLDYARAVERYRGCEQVVLEGGNHSFTKFPDLIPKILEFAGL